VPTESWHNYQLQYKDSLSDPGWSNLGSPVGGNDLQQSLYDLTPAANRFYCVIYQ
jgi:hypothetical protein